MENMGINQLANMFMGNPQPLAQKVRQAQQHAKPGTIPQDLEAAIALQKIQEMRQAAGNQQAMQAGGPQPTVVDQLRQALAPHLQAAQRGLPQAMGQPAPQGAPQPAPQGLPQVAPQAQQPAPQPENAGLPQLPSDLGQHLAGGGIIAFAGGGKAAKQKEFEDAIAETQRQEDLDGAPEQAPQDYRGNGQTQTIFRPNGTMENVDRADAQAVARMPPPNPPSTQGGLASYFMTKEQQQAQQQQAQQANPSDALKIIAARMNQDPEAMALTRQKRLETEVGGPNTEFEKAMIAELQAKRAKAQASADPLLEWARGVAGARPGQKWWQSGLAGSEYAGKVAAQREAADTEFLNQILGHQQKVNEAERGYKMSKFTLGDTERNRIYTETFDAAKAQNASDDVAKKLAQDAVLQRERLESEAKLAKERNENQLKVANAPGQSERIANRIMALEKIGTPQSLAEAKRLQEVYGSITGSGAAGVGAAKNLTNNIRLAMANYNNILDPLKGANATEEQKAEARAKLPILQKRLEALSGIVEEETGVPGGEAPPPPPGFVKQ
jgi:hypothetical protein